jgi:hypothetical protein
MNHPMRLRQRPRYRFAVRLFKLASDKQVSVPASGQFNSMCAGPERPACCKGYVAGGSLLLVQERFITGDSTPLEK